MNSSVSTFLRQAFLGVLFAIPGILCAQTLVDDSLFSPSLGRTKHMEVRLPKGYSDTVRYPMILLLHGFAGNYRNWFELSGLARYSHDLELILVTPDAENSWYVNQAQDSLDRFEDYIIQDLFNFVVKKYNVDTTRVAIGGLSMGGYGALVLGLRHPGMFSLIAALSGSLFLPNGIPDLEKIHREIFRPTVERAFGSLPSDLWREHDVVDLASKLDSAHTPYLYLATGIQDELEERLPLYRAFADTLRHHRIAYEYHETPGRHNWEYWDKEIQGVLRRIAEMWHLHSSAISDR